VASYELRIKPSAAKELEALPLKDRRRLVTRIRQLSAEPRPTGSEKLTGESLYRVRQGNYRVVYEIHDPSRTVTIFRVAHRRDVYR
jgi:mRNA interferase RelE/StbE